MLEEQVHQIDVCHDFFPCSLSLQLSLNHIMLSAYSSCFYFPLLLPSHHIIHVRYSGKQRKKERKKERKKKERKKEKRPYYNTFYSQWLPNQKIYFTMTLLCFIWMEVHCHWINTPCFIFCRICPIFFHFFETFSKYLALKWNHLNQYL